ncbi:MAG: outer membrane beta-barrel protein, partial [Bdellovibrionia bacterium]
LTPELVFGFGVFNGWNNFYDTNAAKTLGARLAWKASDALSLTYNFIGGAEQDNESMNQRHVHEFNAVWTSETWSFGLESLYGSEQNVPAILAAGVTRDLAVWSGWGLQARWKISDWYEVNPRIEWFNDLHGYTLGNGEQKVWSASITEAYHFSEGIEPRVEARYDKTSADGTFSRKGGAVTDQFTFLLALIYTPGSF